MRAAAASSPAQETIRDGSYAPLSRPLYVYTSRASLDRPEVAEFLRFYLTDAAAYAEQVGLVASAEEVYAANLAKLEEAVAGNAPDDPPRPRPDRLVARQAAYRVTSHAVGRRRTSCSAATSTMPSSSGVSTRHAPARIGWRALQ